MKYRELHMELWQKVVDGMKADPEQDVHSLKESIVRDMGYVTGEIENDCFACEEVEINCHTCCLDQLACWSWNSAWHRLEHKLSTDPVADAEFILNSWPEEVA